MLAQFRPAVPAGPVRNVLKTAGQTVVFWTVFLCLVPMALVWLERQFGVPSFAFDGQVWAPWIGFAVASVLGLWSGATMAVCGEGTPLPLDCPRELVVRGPYRFVRNPMAVAGLAQGTFVGLWLGSPLTLIYPAIGGVLWNTWVRPIEEEDLKARFGEDFLHYCNRVRCWWPRVRPY